MAVLTLIASLGTVWRLDREIRKPKQDLNAMVKQHDRVINGRITLIMQNRRRCDMALRCIMDILDAKDFGQLDDTKQRLIDFLMEEDTQDENTT